MLWLLGALGLTGGGIGIAALLGGGPAMLLGAKWLWSWLSHATFLQVVCGALVAFALVQHFELAHARKQAVNYSRQLERCTSARHADQLAYTTAQTQAQAKNRADVQRIETQQQEVTTDVETDYRRKLDALRRELRAPGTSAPQGSAGKPGVPQVPNASSGPDGQAVPLPSGDVLRAAETELQLNALIDWVSKQTTVAH